MTQAYIEKHAEQLQQFFNEPQKYFQQAQNAQIEFMNQLNIFWQEFPQAYQKYVTEQQQKAHHLQEALSESWKKKPHDWAALGSIISDFNTEQFSTYVEKIQRHQERWQKLLSPYTSLEMPFLFKDLIQNAQDEVKKTTNEMLSTGEQKIQELNEKTKENLQATQRAVTEAQKHTQAVTSNVTDSVQKHVKNVSEAATQAVKKSVNNAVKNTKEATKPAVKVASKTSVRASAKNGGSKTAKKPVIKDDSQDAQSH